MYNAEAGMDLPIEDREIADREHRLRQLGLGNGPDAEFDKFAAELAEATDSPYAMVNFVTGEQFFAGLAIREEAGGSPDMGRTMTLEQGFCPEVVVRRKSLTLPDVFASPRFAGNWVVDQAHIRNYAGIPLIDERTDTVLGTICIVGTEPRPKETGREIWHLMREHRDRLMRIIYDRTGGAPTGS
jgi:GAF domain-containing protein